ncbi:hypothetical protein OV090_10985 [Nannocystis sp. RBIL2]|nr:hypothetical protein [Nannocystis sp. RBIL2]MCY1065289.1 hypothetical protein [Nannocystis sp. RBIL2]
MLAAGLWLRASSRGHAPDGEPCEDGLGSAGLCMPADDTTTGGESTTENDSTTGEDSDAGNGDTTGEGSTARNVDTTSDVGARDGNPGTPADTSGARSSDALADGDSGCNLTGDPALGLLALPWWLARRRRR